MLRLNQSLPKERNLPSNLHIVEKFSCKSDSPDCMKSKCKECELLDKIAESCAFETGYHIQWMKTSGSQGVKVSVSIDVRDVSCNFNTHVKTLKRHIHLKCIQHTAFNKLKWNLKKNILIQVDYSENYVNKDPRWLLSAKVVFDIYRLLLS